MGKGNSFSNGPHDSGAVQSGSSYNGGPDPVRHDWFCCCIYCLMGQA